MQTSIFIKRILLITIIIAGMLQFSACDLELGPNSCQGDVKIPEEVKDWFFFKDSSIWVYKDSLSGDLDTQRTLFVGARNEWYQKQVGKNSPCFEVLYHSNFSSFYNQQINCNITCSPRRNPIDFSTLPYEITFWIKNVANLSEPRVSFIGTDSISAETPVYGGFINQLQSISINGKSYSNLIHMYYKIPHPYDWVTRVWYAKNVGMVKYYHTDGRIWELIYSKIKQ